MFFSLRVAGHVAWQTVSEGRPRALWLAFSSQASKPLLAKLREQQLDLEAGNKEVREALLALKGKSEATEAAAAAPPAAHAAAH